MRKPVLILAHNNGAPFIDVCNQYVCLFDPMKYEVTVAYLTSVASDTALKHTLAEQVVFFDMQKRNLRGLKIKAIRTLLAFCREKQFQFVICHRYKPSYVMMWVAKFYRIPSLIFVMHELHTMSSRARQCCIALLARKNMLFAGVSNAVRDDMRRNLWCIPKERIATLYNAIDIEQTEPLYLSREAARNALHLSMDAFIFGHIARFVPNKNQQSLITAFARIKALCPHSKLVIIGRGELEGALKAQVATLELQNDVVFLGFLADAFRYLKAFDCFVLPSVQEAFGRVLLEAMLAKLPIIATDVHGIPEVLGETNKLVPPRNPIALKHAMQQVYEATPEMRHNQGESGYQRVVTQFSIPAFHQQFWISIKGAKK